MEFVQKRTPHIAEQIDWNGDEDISKQLFDLFGTLGEHDRATIYSTLYDVNLLSDNPKNGRNYFDQIKKEPLFSKFAHEMSMDSSSVQSIAMWIYLNIPKLWDRLVRIKMLQAGNSNAGIRYYIPQKDGIEERMTWKEDFKKAFKKIMLDETSLNLRVHVERNDMGRFIRYCIQTDPFPKNEPQFKAGGGDDDIDMALAKRAECFHVVYFPKKRFFRLKSDFNRSQCDRIADAFANSVFGLDRIQKPKQQRDLSPFTRRPRKFDFTSEPDFRSLRYSGASYSLDMGAGGKEEYRRVFPTGDFFDNVAQRKELYGLLDREPSKAPTANVITTLELYLEITIKSGDKPIIDPDLFGHVDDPRKEKTFSLTVRNNGWHAKPSPNEHDENTLENVLRCMGLEDHFVTQGLANRQIN